MSGVDHMWTAWRCMPWKYASILWCSTKELVSAPIWPLSAKSLFTGVFSYQGSKAMKPSFTEIIVDVAKFSVNPVSLTKFKGNCRKTAQTFIFVCAVFVIVTSFTIRLLARQMRPNSQEFSHWTVMTVDSLCLRCTIYLWRDCITPLYISYKVFHRFHNSFRSLFSRLRKDNSNIGAL